MPDFVTSALTTVTLMALVLAAAAFWQLRRRRIPAELQQAVLLASERNAGLDAQIAELTKERDFLAQIQALGKIGYVVADLVSKQVYWSDSMFEIRRVPRRDVIPWDEAMAFFHPDDLPKYLALRAAAIAERRDWEFSTRILRGDGTVGWEHAVGRPQFDAAGNLTGIVFCLQDITDRTAAEEEHRRLSLVATTTTNSVIISGLEGRIEWVNEAFTRATGYSLAEAHGQRAMDLLRGPASDPATIMLARERISRGEGIRDVEMVNYTKAGEPYWVNVEVQPIRDAGGKVVQFISVGTNITARKAAERRIRELNESLEASLRQLRAIADNIPALIIYLDAERRFRFMNRTAEHWLAASFEQIEGKTVEEAMPDDYVRSTRSARSRLTDGQDREEVTLRYPDGVLRTVDAAYVRDVDNAGRLLGYYVLVIDISERKAAETRLNRSEEHLANAQAVAAIGSVEIDLGSGVATWSEELFRLCGLDPSAGSPDGPGFARLVHPDDRGLVLDVTARVRRGVPIEPFEIRVLLPDGGMRWLRRQQKLIDGPDGRPARAIVTMQDVTQARAAEQKILELNESLAASLRQLRAIADNVLALIVYIDADGRYRFLNRTAERWLGVTAEDAMGKTAAEALLADYVATTAADRALLYRGALRKEDAVRYPDGVMRTVDITSVPDFGPDGGIRGHYAFAVDISERKAMEEQLRQSQKLEAIGKLTGGVAHDFNNLLAVISGNLELADEALEGRDDVRNVLRPAIRATERGATLTQSLLAYARQQPLSPSAVDLSGLVREMTELLRRTIPMNIEFKLDVGAGLWRCLVDPGQLQNALLNLVVNARDAMPDGGRLTIEIANAQLDDDYAAAHAEVVPGDYVMLAVSDTGTGMAPDVVARAFEPFFTTKGVGKGTGLGLSMVYGFAKQSLGHVKIYSEVGDGTTVRLYLPRVADETEVAPAAPPDELRGHGEVILVVEDDADLRTMAFALLRSLGYEVLEAAGGEAALRILQTRTNISLMLTDVVLAGGMNGRQLAERVATVLPHIRVLYMSGYTENAILHHGRLDQGVNFLQKPFSKSELARKIRTMLSETPLP